MDSHHRRESLLLPSALATRPSRRCGGPRARVSAAAQSALRLLVAVSLLILVGLATAPQANADIVYVYDELGRLVGVIDPSSDTAVYSYDAVGNLLGIARYASSSVSIIDFQPKSGPVGTVVTIRGTGFSATPASNTVTFNGASASVSSSTPTMLVVSVPAGATTGPIEVTAPGGSATSSPFTVTTTSGVPAITSFSPTIGTPGTTVTISGTSFDPIPTNDKVSFYGVPLAKTAVTSASATSLVTTVPTNARSGPLRVATPGGTAVSTADFFVPTGGFTAAQVAFTGRIAVGGASVDVPVSANTIGLVVFDGLAGQRLDLGTTLLSGVLGSVTVYRPDGVVLPTTPSTSSGVAVYLPPLPVAGVYVIEAKAQAFAFTVRLTLSEEVTATGVVGGSSVELALTRAGQRGRVSFPGTAGQRISAGVTSTFGSLTLSFLKPDDTALIVQGTGMPGALDSPPLPSSGTYALTIERSSAATGSATVTLSEEVTGTITIDGASVPISIPRAGQRARVTFTGTAGQLLSLGITGATVGGSVSVYRPGGATHLSPVNYGTPAADVDFPTIVTTGTHEIVIDPSGVGTGNLTLTLSTPVSLTTALNGTALAVATTRPGQYAVVTFPGTANGRASHVLSGTTMTGYWILKRPDGTLMQVLSLPGTTFIDTYTLPASGTYTIVLDLSAGTTGSTTLTSYAVPADVTGSIAINGGTVPVTLSVPGQNAALSFAATSGQGITVRLTGNTLGCTSVSIVPPGGGSIGSASGCGASFNLTGSVVTTTGTHTVTINPQGPGTGSITVEVTLP